MPDSNAMRQKRMETSQDVQSPTCYANAPEGNCQYSEAATELPHGFGNGITPVM